jgi:hypothetical protein
MMGHIVTAAGTDALDGVIQVNATNADPSNNRSLVVEIFQRAQIAAPSIRTFLCLARARLQATKMADGLELTVRRSGPPFAGAGDVDAAAPSGGGSRNSRPERANKVSTSWRHLQRVTSLGLPKLRGPNCTS